MDYLNVALGIIFFSVTAWSAIEISKRICRTIEPFADGPASGEPPLLWMFVCAAVVGAALAVHHMAIVALGCTAIVNGFLIGCWYCDTRCGIVPDWFTLPPLAALLIPCLLERDFFPFAVAFALFLMFAIPAYCSGGLGMGWGDAKLVAFGGALVGENAFFVTMLACGAAIMYAKLKNRVHEPMALAPFLVIGFESGLAFMTIVP